MTTSTVEPSTVTAREVHFVEPIPGFDGVDAFTLTAIDPNGLLYAMRSVRDPQLRFVLAPPEAFFGDYHPAIDDDISVVLEANEVEVLVILSIGSGLHDATANLRAPIVLAPATGRALQLILDDETLPMRRPLLGPPRSDDHPGRPSTETVT
jgi:flagellar assembly factor FliW